MLYSSEGCCRRELLEARLAERARTGDVDAFDDLMAPRIERMVRLAMAIIGDEAEARETVQEALTAIWRHLPELREPELFEAWAGRILIHACQLTLKRAGRRRVHEVRIPDADDPRTPSTAGPEEMVIRSRAIERAFDSLDANARALLVLHHHEDLSLEEIAARLEIPVGTVKSRLYAARRALERALEADV